MSDKDVTNSSHSGSKRDPFAHVPSSRIIQGEAIRLDDATARSIINREESKAIQEELKTLKPVTSPFSELFFNDGMATEPIGAEPIKEKEVEFEVEFEDAFLDSPSKPLADDNQQLLDDMDVDEPITMQWTKQRITSNSTAIRALPESKTCDERISLTKEMLGTAQVIAQVEDKFIVIKTQDKICVVDQHAADERVALEKLENALFNSDFNEAMRIELTKKQLLVGDILKGTSVMPAKRVILTRAQMEVVRQHREELAKWCFTYKPPSESDKSVLLTGVPSICGRLASVNDFVEFLDELNCSGGGKIKPECVKRILASQACRYAIMFGDRLTNQQCQRLISDLAKCDFAFICAHGRPSVIPLIDLNDAERSDENVTAATRQSANSNGKKVATVSFKGPKRVIRHRVAFEG
jgi:DNA mismatch repair ATPase MutL